MMVGRIAKGQEYLDRFFAIDALRSQGDAEETVKIGGCRFSFIKQRDAERTIIHARARCRSLSARWTFSVHDTKDHDYHVEEVIYPALVGFIELARGVYPRMGDRNPESA